jgi:hypothetical protein
MIDKIFDWCVALLVITSSELGITYKEINVLLFVIIMPALISLSI